jgi:multidrug efflux pump subunit AcrA (membrane-fusion protein)
MQRPAGILSFCLVFSVFGLLILLGCGQDRGDNRQGAEEVEPAIPVTVATVEAEDITTFMTFTGKIQAVQDITIRSEVGGILEEVHFEEGDRVEEDQILARVEDEEFVLALREAEAAFFSAESNLMKMRRLSRPQEIDTARSAYERAEADFSMARITWERRKQLYERGVVSKHEYDVAELDYKSKRAARDATKKQLDLVEEGARSEDIEMARFQVKQAEAKLSLARERLGDTRIRSPISGILARKMVDRGDLVALGTPIGNVLDMTTVETEIGATEKELPHLRMDCDVTAIVVAYAERLFPGRIACIGVKADEATGTFPVRVEFDNASQLLRPGMVAEVRVEKETYQNVVTIRQDTVLDKVSRKVVFVIEDGRSRERPVELGPLIGDEVIVKKGLTVGEPFVVVGQQSLKNGSRVRIEGEE